MEKVKNNSRLIVAGLIIVGVLVLALTGNKDKADQQQTGQTNTAAQTETVAATADDSKTPASVEEPIGSQPVSGPVVVDQVEDSYSATVRKGDNQTVIVRQMVNEFLQDRSQSLSPEQRLYIETVLVDSLPRNNLIFPDQVVQIKADILSSAVDASATLSEAQLAAWSNYL